jgi:2-phosphosulfolactate phosphatase
MSTTASSVVSHKIHVLGKKEDLDSVRVAGKVVIVLDVLFATSTIVAALAHGAASVIPTLDEVAARVEAERYHAGSYVLAGELYADTLQGFAPPTPLALLAHGVAHKHIIYSTTNGTVALMGAAEANDVYAAALLNAGAVVDHVLARHADQTILIVCSGSLGNLNLEDYYGAGYLVDLLARALGDQADFSDAARVARVLFRSGDPLPMLTNCRVGRLMTARGLQHEIAYAARLSDLAVVPRLEGGRVVATTPA